MRLKQLLSSLAIAALTVNANAHDGHHQHVTENSESHFSALMAWLEHFFMSDFHLMEWIAVAIVLSASVFTYKNKNKIRQWFGLSSDKA